METVATSEGQRQAAAERVSPLERALQSYDACLDALSAELSLLSGKVACVSGPESDVVPGIAGAGHEPGESEVVSRFVDLNGRLDALTNRLREVRDNLQV